MNIYAIMLVKNEADIVKSVIKDAEKWADKIFILNNGSTDGTWVSTTLHFTHCCLPFSA